MVIPRLLHRAEATFWGTAAFATGLAVRHRRSLRLALPVLLAAVAFGLGRAAGLAVSGF
jgi:hypothetical protein